MSNAYPQSPWLRAGCWIVGATILIAGCATSKGTRPEDTAGDQDSKSEARAEKGDYPPLSINGADYQTLGELVRKLGEGGKGGGVVLVAGLEERPTPPVNVAHGAFGDGLARLVGPADCLVRDGGYYQFIYPPGYEALLDVTVWDQVHPRYRDLSATYAVGAGTDLYNALALLSEILKTTVIADNAIADVWCGELYLQEAPVAVILEGLLRSARVLPEAYVIESSDQYIFVRSAANRTAADVCINRESLSAEQAAMLARRVDVRVPAEDGALRFGNGAVPLKSVLPTLSKELGFPVEVAPEMAEIPINRATFLGLSASDVLNLIVRQWPIAQFGYEVEGRGVRFLRTS